MADIQQAFGARRQSTEQLQEVLALTWLNSKHRRFQAKTCPKWRHSDTGKAQRGRTSQAMWKIPSATSLRNSAGSECRQSNDYN